MNMFFGALLAGAVFLLNATTAKSAEYTFVEVANSRGEEVLVATTRSATASMDDMIIQWRKANPNRILARCGWDITVPRSGTLERQLSCGIYRKK